MSKRVVEPSPTQREALERMGAWQGRLYRWPGGYWLLIPCKEPNVDVRPPKAWYADTRTVQGLESRGWVARTRDYDEEWKDTRAITSAGMALIGGASSNAFTVGEASA